MSLFPLSYIEQILEDDAEFPAAALRELQQLQANLKLKSTYTPATSVSGLLNYWLTNRELKPYDRGRVVDDVTAASVVDPEHGIDAIEDAWQIDIVELMFLLESRGMRLPDALIAQSGRTPDDDLPNDLGYTIRGAALALSEKYGLAYDAIHKAILNAARQGRLEMLDPCSGMPWDFDGRDFNQRIRIKDLNEWFKESGVEYRLGDGNSDASRMGTPMKKKALLDLLRGYPELPNAMQANDPEFIACRVPPERAPGKKGGYYYMEEVERVCESRWGKKNIPPTSSSPSFPFSQAARGMKDGKKFG